MYALAVFKSLHIIISGYFQIPNAYHTQSPKYQKIPNITFLFSQKRQLESELVLF